MPSKNMLPKGARRQSVKKEYRAQRSLIQEQAAARKAAGEEPEVYTGPTTYDTAEFYTTPSPFAHVPGLVVDGPTGGKHPDIEGTKSQKRYAAPKYVPEPVEIATLDDLEAQDGIRSFTAEPNAKDLRLDAYLAKALPDISRARVQVLLAAKQILVDGKAEKPSFKLKGGELIEIEGDPQPAPLKAEPEDIPLDIVYEDKHLAVINKPAGMVVHPGAGEASQHGTLVNALLHHFGKKLANADDSVRPGIVHRLDKETSGLIIVAKNDSTHRKLGEMFSNRELRKVYLALVHGKVPLEEGRIDLAISRDLIRRHRMTTRRAATNSTARSAVSNYKVLERFETKYGPFTLLRVHIETGRTHQIRVHMQALGHAVVGDHTYGAPHHIPMKSHPSQTVTPERNFLHAAELDFVHPQTGEELSLRAPLPSELQEFLQVLTKA